MLGIARRHLDLCTISRAAAVLMLVWASNAFAAAVNTAAIANPKPCCASKASNDDQRDSKKEALPPTLRKKTQQPTTEKRDPKSPDSIPVYACDATTIKIDPVWTGKNIKATWVIRNKGTENLTISLKGG